MTRVTKPLYNPAFWSLFSGPGEESNYPKYNITAYPNRNVPEFHVEVAITGFSKEDLNIEFNPQTRILTVKAVLNSRRKYDEENFVQVVRNLATRAFSISFRIDQNLEIDKDKIWVENGILNIVCTENIPPERKPYMIDIR